MEKQILSKKATQKTTLFLMLLVMCLVFCQTTGANAAKQSIPKTPAVELFKVILPVVNQIQFSQFVGAKIDPVDSTIVYDMYGVSGALTSIIIFKNGVQQSSSGYSISGSYVHTGGALYSVSGTITRPDSTTVNCNGTYDIS